MRVETNTLYVTFLREPPDATAVAAVLGFRTPVDDLTVIGRELYRLRRRAVGESTFDGAAVERALRMPGTNRNMKTVRKIVHKYC